MSNDKNFDSVYSQKIRAGKRRTYFFDVRKTKREDYYITLTESTRRDDGHSIRHKIFLYKEDFDRFLAGLTDAIDHVKTELLPDYDYAEFTRKHEQWDRERAEQQALDSTHESSPTDTDPPTDTQTGSSELPSEDDLSW